ncbi:hypothetical protein LIX60_04085 [Streptomyces sp. S07_1.15]|uniref:amidase family protein n=1 Tax=Streptomyces sp. S07_1.15 TaxID=2873925 RepID=UPI001D1588CF|nr:amidase family protein [Streptomyces sp. S07_1.15]MCC3650673.1 hypothetical protein [Streptomyces sp. S07_1.15]
MMSRDSREPSLPCAERHSRDGDGAFVEELCEAAAALPPAPLLPRTVTRVRAEAAPQKDPYNAVVRWVDVSADADSGALAGIGVSLKDSVAIGGLPLTAGSAALQGFVPSGDATVTRRLLEAGASIRAVTNMDDLAFSGAGDTSYYGPVRNPHDPAVLAGGSSGGAAASLFLDGIDVAIGTDQGGSVRLPAAWTGVYGLKPTFGRIPYTGVVGMEARLDHIGILARSPELMGRVLAVLGGPDGLDGRQAPWGRPLPAASGPVTVRVVTASLLHAEDRTRALLERALRTWSDGGVIVEPTSFDPADHGPVPAALFIEGALATLRGTSAPWTGPAFYWEELQQHLSRGVADHIHHLSPSFRFALAAAEELQRREPGRAYGRGLAARTRLIAAVDAALEGADFLVLPTAPCEALPVGEGLSDIERTTRGWGVLGNTGPFNVTGHPALSVPVAVSTGLPVGAMLVGRHNADEELLRFAQRLAIADQQAGCHFER